MPKGGKPHKNDDPEKDPTFQGHHSTNSSNEPVRRSSRLNRNTNPIDPTDFDYITSDEEQESFNSAAESLENTLNEDHTSNAEESILNISQSFPLIHTHLSAILAQDFSSLTKMSTLKDMTETEIKQMIDQKVKEQIDATVRESTQAAALSHQNKFPNMKMPNIPSLTMKNYFDWARKIRAALEINGIWIDPKKTPQQYSDDERDNVSPQAVRYISLYIESTNNVHINDKNRHCFHTVWHMLGNFYRPNTSMAMCDFFTSIRQLQYRPNQCMRSHLMSLEHEFNKMLDIEEEIPEQYKVAIVLSSIRDSPDFENLFFTAKWLKKEEFTMSRIRDAILNREDFLKRSEVNQTSEQAHAMTHKQNYNQRSKARNSFSNKKKIVFQRRNASKFNCELCRMDNHYTEWCKKNPKRNQNQQQTRPPIQLNSQQSHFTQENNVQSQGVSFADDTEQENTNYAFIGSHVACHSSTGPIKNRLGASRNRSPYKEIYPRRLSREEDEEMEALNRVIDQQYDDDQLNKFMNDHSPYSEPAGNKNLTSDNVQKFTQKSFQLIKNRHIINHKLRSRSSLRHEKYLNVNFQKITSNLQSQEHEFKLIVSLADNSMNFKNFVPIMNQKRPLLITPRLGKVNFIVGKVNSDIVKVNSDLHNQPWPQQDVGKVNSDVGKVNSDVGKVNSDVGKVNSDVGKVNSDLHNQPWPQQDVGKVTSDVGKVNFNVVKVNSDQHYDEFKLVKVDLHSLRQNLLNSTHVASILSNHIVLNTMYQANQNVMNKNKMNYEINPHFTSWIIDSGATIHMSMFKHILSNFRMSAGRSVVVSNGNSIPIEGFGEIAFQIPDTNNKIHNIKLTNVAYVPQLTVNLISVPAISKAFNANIIFNENSCILSKNNVNIMLGKNENSSYIMSIVHTQSLTDNHKSHVCIHELHKRMSHKNLDHIRNVKNALKLQITKCDCSNDCVSCIKSKITRKSFPKESMKPQNPRDIIASDVCGDFKTRSLGGAYYYITFNCIATGYTEVKAIRNKSDSKREIINFMEKCFTQFGSYPKIFRSDRGGEYIDSELQQYLESKGIKTELTVADSPQQNGISERKNRTLLDAVRALLIERNLPESLWAEALNYANNTFNSIPQRNEIISPRDKYFGKPMKTEFIEFGAPIIFKLNTKNLSKLKPRGESGIFVGIDDKSKGYRIFAQGKVQIRRDIKFLSSDPQKKVAQSISISEEDYNSPISAFIPRRSSRLQEKESLMLTSENIEPRTYKQAIECKDKDKWISAMREEINSITKNKTWTAVDLPEGSHSIGSKWVFKIKYKDNGEVDRYKARLVAQGFTQIFGEDYDEVFAPVARSTSFRILLTVAGKRNLCVEQYDVVTAFLNGTIDEDIYIRPPKGFANETKVFKLHKSLYGLKQSARKWNEAMHKCLSELGFAQSKLDNCLYICKTNDDVCYLVIHVDDFLVAAKNHETIKLLTDKISQTFELKRLGKASQFLGININRKQNGLFEINQSNYIKKIASILEVDESRGSLFPMDPGYFKLEGNYLDDNKKFRQIIGMLLYISTNTRPDISASVSILAQRVSKPRDIDLRESIRVVKYLMKTNDHSLILGAHSPNQDTPLKTFTDANWAEERINRKSTGGFICQLYGSTICWSSKKQDVVSISTTESEYYALAEAIRESIWLKNLLQDFDIKIESPVPVLIDSQSCISMVTNEKFSNRTKYIDVRYHFAKDAVRNKIVQLKYVPTFDNVADMLTKPLAGTKIRMFRELAQLKQPN
jgi:hypothetical protein